MEQENNKLKQALITQYAKLSHITASALTEKLQNTAWWNKEKSSLKVQRTIFVISSCVVFIGCCLVLVFSSPSRSTMFRDFSAPYISFATLILSVIVTQHLKSKIKEKITLFNLLQISFNNE